MCFLPKKILAKFQSNKKNLKTSIKFLIGGPFLDKPCNLDFGGVGVWNRFVRMLSHFDQHKEVSI